MPSISVLLVEDEALISMMVSDTLSEVGFAVYEAATAEEALRYIGSGGAVDVLFTDINLPGGMSGTELAQAVRALKPDLRVVYASGRYRQDDLPDRVPDSLFVQKPYDLDRLCVLLAGHTAGTPPEHRAAELIPAEA